MRTVLVFSPHADDAAIFCGGAMARFADEGWRVVLARVTDDRFDSVGLPVAETLRRTAEELHHSAAILGVSEVVELGFVTDCLADTPLGTLRERAVRLLRQYRPHTVMSFDPADRFEDNQDHARVAQAVAEAFWVACFDKHHPQHLAEGLAPHTAAERWYFSRRGADTNHVVDITPQLARKIDAVCAHQTQMRNVVNQVRLQFQAAGRPVPALDHAVAGGDLRPLVQAFVGGAARAIAQESGWDGARFAEAYRREGTDALEDLI